MKGVEMPSFILTRKSLFCYSSPKLNCHKYFHLIINYQFHKCRLREVSNHRVQFVNYFIHTTWSWWPDENFHKMFKKKNDWSVCSVFEIDYCIYYDRPKVKEQGCRTKKWKQNNDNSENVLSAVSVRQMVKLNPSFVSSG